jgi:hypothetical protein
MMSVPTPKRYVGIGTVHQGVSMALVRLAIVLIIGATAAVLTGCDGQETGPATRFADTALRYRPTWLPPGLTERSRAYHEGPPASVRRGWAPPNHTVETVNRPAPLTMEVSGPGCTVPNYATAVDVGGRPGRFATVERPSGARSAILCWQPNDRTRITVTDDSLGLDQATLQRIAESVRSDRATTGQPLRVPEPAHEWIGVGTPLRSMTLVGTSATDWIARYHVSGVAKGDDRHLTVTAGRASPAPDGGEPAKVGERSGRFVTEGGNGGATTVFLVVDLGSALLLTIEAWTHGRAGEPVPGVDTLVRIALGTTVDSGPLAWIGGRPG